MREHSRSGMIVGEGGGEAEGERIDGWVEGRRVRNKPAADDDKRDLTTRSRAKTHTTQKPELEEQRNETGEKKMIIKGYGMSLYALMRDGNLEGGGVAADDWRFSSWRPDERQVSFTGTCVCVCVWSFTSLQ